MADNKIEILTSNAKQVNLMTRAEVNLEGQLHLTQTIYWKTMV